MSNREEILISVRAEYVAKMLNGEKTVELRRRNVNVSPGTRVWIYSKSPQAAIKAHAEITAVVTGEPGQLWRKFHSRTGVTHQEFQSYFDAADKGCALILTNVVKLRKHISLRTMREKVSSFHPPQFYTKLNGRELMLRALKSRVAK